MNNNLPTTTKNNMFQIFEFLRFIVEINAKQLDIDKFVSLICI